MTAHELAQPLRDLADALRPIEASIPVREAANLCAAAAADLEHLADVEFRLKVATGRAIPFTIADDQTEALSGRPQGGWVV